MKAFTKEKLELSVKTLPGVVPTPSVCRGHASLVAFLGFHFPKVDNTKAIYSFRGIHGGIPVSVSSEGSVTLQTSRLVNISRYVKGEEGLWVEWPGERAGVGSGGAVEGRKDLELRGPRPSSPVKGSRKPRFVNSPRRKTLPRKEKRVGWCLSSCRQTCSRILTWFLSQI